ncbi:hypothetical protein [Mycobacteroides abscessus]
MSPEIAVDTALTGEVETPSERAARRLTQLRRAITGVMEILADIYRDDDWKHLTGSDGQPYRNFTVFIQDQLGGSASNARRYRQGIVDLISPLREITGQETPIPITSADIARLGREGAKAVLEQAPGALSGASDQTQKIRELVDTVIGGDRASTSANEADNSEDDQELDDDEIEPQLRRRSTAAPPPMSVPLGSMVPDKLPEQPDTTVDVNSDPGTDITTDDGLSQVDNSPPVAQSGSTEAGFRNALNTLLNADPVYLAKSLDANNQLADDCLAGARMLAQISQMLR